MNLLLINYEYPPIGAGAANATYNIAKCLIRKGHQVTVLTSRFQRLSGWRNEEGINVYRCLAARRSSSQSNIFEMLTFLLSAFFVLPFIIRWQKIDASIVFFSFPCGPLGGWGKLTSGVPYIVSLRGGDVPGNETSLNPIHKFLQPIRRLVFKNSLSIVANSKGLKVLSEKADPFLVDVIPNGVDADFFFQGESQQNDPKKLLFVGRFQHQKNLKFLLEQVDIISKEIENPFELHLVGGGPMENELEDLYKNLKCRDNIYFHAWSGKDQLRKYYQQADCFLNPSFCEGMPNTVLEAMSCGCPVVASDVPGNDDLVIHGETGFLFDYKHPEEFRKFVIKIIQNKDLIVSMGNKGARRVKQAFSWESVSDKYLQILNINSY